jgi:carbohydrate diacid regulator
MVIRAGRFTHVAEAVAHRTAELLAATVAVIDEDDVIVARAAPAGHTEQMSTVPAWNGALRVPIHVHGRSGHVLAATHEETISARLARAVVDFVVSQTAIVEQLPAQDDLRGKVVRDLLAGRIDDEVGILRESQVLGMDLSRPRAVFVIHMAEYILASSSTPDRDGDTEICQRAREVIGQVVRFFNLPSAAICAYLGEGEVAVLKASTSRDLAPWSNEQEATGRLLGQPQCPEARRSGAAVLAGASDGKRGGHRRRAVPRRRGRASPVVSGCPRSVDAGPASTARGRRLLPGRPRRGGIRRDLRRAH